MFWFNLLVGGFTSACVGLAIDGPAGVFVGAAVFALLTGLSVSAQRVLDEADRAFGLGPRPVRVVERKVRR